MRRWQWGCVTIGFAGVHNYAEVLVLRLLIGIVSTDLTSSLKLPMSLAMSQTPTIASTCSRS